MANVIRTDPPARLDLTNFMSNLNTYGQVAKSCRFAVKINPAPMMGEDNLVSRLPYNRQIQDLVYACDAAELPGRGFNVTDVRYYGPSQAFPNNTLYAPANLSFICKTNGIERQFFDDWMNIINPVDSFRFNYPSQYYCDIDIYQFAEYTSESTTPSNKQHYRGGWVLGPTRSSNAKVVYGWTLRKAFPTLVNPQQVTWADTDILRLNVTITYKYWDRIKFLGAGQ